jgi:hypothetical protein
MTLKLLSQLEPSTSNSTKEPIAPEMIQEPSTTMTYTDINNTSENLHAVVINQVGNSKFPPSGHLIFVYFTNISNENKTREIQKWPRARDRTSLIPLRCVFFYTN